jgi:ureidoglycolate dehydrogenase (NAD+)
MSSEIVVDAEALRAFVAEIFEAAGFSADHAAVTAEALVWADLRGHAGHGILRVPTYLDYLPGKSVDPGAAFEITFEKGALVRADANLMIGPAAMSRAARLAVARAADTAVAWVLVKDHAHAGAAGFYARMISDAGMIGMIMTASRPMMAYHGTTNAVLGTNPICVAVPGGPLIDMSTASIAKGRIAALAAAGTALPAGVALTADGAPTTDAAAAATALPLGGAKGAGLSLMIECVTSLALGNPLVATALADPALMTSYRLNSVVVAVDVAALGDADGFAGHVAETIAAIKAQPRADGLDEILIAGERGARMERMRREHGIPLSEKTWARLTAAARKLGVQAPGLAV